MPDNVAVRVLNRAHSITAEVEIPKAGAEGVLLSHGGNSGGYTFFIKDAEERRIKRRRSRRKTGIAL